MLQPTSAAFTPSHLNGGVSGGREEDPLTRGDQEARYRGDVATQGRDVLVCADIINMDVLILSSCSGSEGRDSTGKCDPHLHQRYTDQ